MFKKLKQFFCFHQWEPVELIEFYYNELGIRYARCKNICQKCGKEETKSHILHGNFQDGGSESYILDKYFKDGGNKEWKRKFVRRSFPF